MYIEVDKCLLMTCTKVHIPTFFFLCRVHLYITLKETGNGRLPGSAHILIIVPCHTPESCSEYGPNCNSLARLVNKYTSVHMIQVIIGKKAYLLSFWWAKKINFLTIFQGCRHHWFDWISHIICSYSFVIEICPDAACLEVPKLLAIAKFLKTRCT